MLNPSSRLREVSWNVARETAYQWVWKLMDFFLILESFLIFKILLVWKFGHTNLVE